MRRKVRLPNPEILTWARESVGYTIEDVAHYLKKSPQTIIAWEKGSDAPTFRQLEKLAKKFKRSLAVFYLPEVPSESPLPRDFRRLPRAPKSAFSPEARFAFRELQNLLNDLIQIEENLAFDFPQINLSDDPRIKGRQVREKLGISVIDQLFWTSSYKALSAWRSILFDHGILVIQFSLPVDEVRGFSIMQPPLAGIGITSQDVPEARIFSIFHEVAHLCLRMPGVSNEEFSLELFTEQDRVESFCNSFAAEFLLPSVDPDIKEILHKVGSSEPASESINQYARNCRVSKYVLAFQAYTHQFASQAWLNKTLRIWQEQNRERKTEGKKTEAHLPLPIAIRARYGERFLASVYEALEQRFLTLHDVSDILNLSPSRIEKIAAKLF